MERVGREVRRGAFSSSRNAMQTKWHISLEQAAQSSRFWASASPGRRLVPSPSRPAGLPGELHNSLFRALQITALSQFSNRHPLHCPASQPSAFVTSLFSRLSSSVRSEVKQQETCQVSGWERHLAVYEKYSITIWYQMLGCICQRPAQEGSPSPQASWLVCGSNRCLSFLAPWQTPLEKPGSVDAWLPGTFRVIQLGYPVWYLMGLGVLNRLIGFYTHAQKDLISSVEFMAGEKR